MAINVYLLSLKNKINNQSRNRIIDTENVLIVARWEEGWGIGEKGDGSKKYKLVITE